MPKLMDLSDAKQYIDTYFASNAGVRQWLDNTARQGIAQGYVTTMMGRKRRFPKNPYNPQTQQREHEQFKRSQMRMMTNHPIQGTSADITKWAVVFIQEAIRKEELDARFQMFVHDEVVMVAREDQAEKVAEVMKYEMERAGALFLKRVKPAVQYKIADHWSH